MLNEVLNAFALAISFVVLSTATVELLSRTVSRTYLHKRPTQRAQPLRGSGHQAI
ncbi:hypothetical protein [uncultured Nitratireductor sp.]|uniref:hypothetical protein n=1 Tax=uncultured Nitratireductor sp. TaxID=520953 RepID=UPI0026003FDC|nr:hypothetical protein [uncultured Nitratireductor sp.]